MSDWREIATWDATAEPEPASRPSPRLREALTEAGLVRVGLLGVRFGANRRSMHPKIREQRIEIWRTPDRRVLAQNLRDYGVDELELQSVLGDGTIVRTRWTSRPGGVPLGWYRQDPDAPPDDGIVTRLRSNSAGPKLRHDASHQPAAGLHTRRVDDLDDVLHVHLDTVDQLVDEAGPPEPIDVTMSGAIARRGAEVANAVLRRHTLSMMPPMMLAMSLPLLVPSVGLPDFSDLDPSASPAVLFEAMSARASRSVGAMAGYGVGVLFGFQRGMARLMSAAMIGGMILVPIGLETSTGSAATLFRPDTLAWATAGFLVGGAVGRLVLPVMQRLLQRLTPSALDPVTPRPTAHLLREVYGARAAAISTSVDELQVEVARTDVDALLREAGWTRLGARKVADRDGGTPGEALWTTVTVWRSPDGATIGEPRRMPGGGEFLVLRTGLADGSVFETRTLPDPGPVERTVQRTDAGSQVTTPLVTRADLSRGRWWPTRATLRVADRPVSRLRVAHADDPAGALTLHASRLAGHASTTAGSLSDAIALATEATRRRPEPTRSLARLGSGLSLGVLPLVFGGALLDLGAAYREERWSSAWMPLVYVAIIAGSVLRLVPEREASRRRKLQRFFWILPLVAGTAFLVVARPFDITGEPTPLAPSRAAVGVVLLVVTTLASARLISERELRRTA